MGFPQSVIEANRPTAEELPEPLPEIVEVTKPKRPTGAHITEGNARYLAFAAAFTAADSEAFSVLSNRQETIFAPGGELPSIRGTEQRLAKLTRLGALQKTRNLLTQTTHYGITKEGIGAAWSFGYDLDSAETLAGLSIKRLTHYQMIAHVAAQFASPLGFFRESLGIEPVELDQLVNERKMRIAYDPIKKRLETDKEGDHRGDFGRWRDNLLKSASSAVQNGRLRWSEIVEARLALLTIGSPQRGDTKRKAVHQPDLAVILDRDRTGSRAKNLLIEVELSKKSWEAYDSILATIAAELEHGMVYDRAVYFVSGKQVASLLRRVDEAGKYDLIRSGKLVILDLMHRDETPVIFNNRVQVGGR